MDMEETATTAAQERKALCAELAQRARAMSNAHSPTWWNLL